MAFVSSIEWTESTWNPVTGCTKISLGCKNCYAERMALRLQAMGRTNYLNGFKLTLHEQSLTLPLQWRRPQIIFVNSMSDLFHEQVPDSFIVSVFHIMNQAYWHNFQILTKRSERMLSLATQVIWTPNIWMGVTVETKDYLFRIDHLRQTSAHIKFISFEPLLGQISNINLTGIDLSLIHI